MTSIRQKYFAGANFDGDSPTVNNDELKSNKIGEWVILSRTRLGPIEFGLSLKIK